MTDREVMQQALEALEDERYVIKYTHIVEAITALRKALEQPEQGPMTEVADRFAHRMALELECVLSDGAYSNKWYKSAMQVLSEYRSAMNEIHEQHSPTFMGEPHSLEERHTAEKRDRQNAAQWDKPSASFNDWWNGDYDDPANPFVEDSAAYWAWAGWKAALAQPQQQAEPLAMRMPEVGDKVICLEDESLGTVESLTAGGSPDIKFDDGSHGTYLLREFAELFGYVAPPQRQWVGLTDEEVKHEWEVWRASLPRYIGFAQGIEAKLKERNT